jgi:hypothetical protein
MNLVVIAHASTGTDTDKREDDAVVANHYVVFYIDEREYLTVVADVCSG